MPANLVNLWVRTPPGNKGLTILEKSPANNLFAANANLQDFFENLQIFATLKVLSCTLLLLLQYIYIPFTRHRLFFICTVCGVGGKLVD